MPGPGRARRLVVVQHDVDAPPAQLGDAAAEAGLELDVRVVPEGDELPETLTPDEGLVVLGGIVDVSQASDHPYLFRVMDLVRMAAAGDRPVLGLCLGGQLAAAALGGSVRRGDAGSEIGWVLVRPTGEGRADPVAAAIGEGALLFQWHHDVFTPPPRATPILTGGRYGSQGFRRGTVWGLQSHPEVTPEYIREWAEAPGSDRELEAAGVGLDELLDQADVRAARARRLLEAWCRVVAGVAPLRPRREGGRAPGAGEGLVPDGRRQGEREDPAHGPATPSSP